MAGGVSTTKAQPGRIVDGGLPCEFRWGLVCVAADKGDTLLTCTAVSLGWHTARKLSGRESGFSFGIL